MQTEQDELLAKVKELLRENMTEITYNMWIRDLQYVSFSDSEIVFKSETTLIQDMMRNQYASILQKTFAYLTNKYFDISFVVPNEETKEGEEEVVIPETSTTENKIIYSNSSLNPRYTFSSFVVGNNNRLAHAAALAVTEAPGASYNPLFLYGGAGLGKTHLMHAIGNEIIKNNRGFKILYVTSEQFTIDFVNAIKDNTNEKFRNKYRTVDVLLIDDIQFISKKEGVQEEFFHTFNALQEKGKQIVISSDKPPRDIPLLEERLKSRFEWGLIADISAPDYETRLAILRKKADLEKIVIDTEILANIATKVDSNIRELEGALNKLVSIASLTKTPITIEMAEQSINDIVAKKERVLSIEYIQEIVSKYFGVDVKDLKSSKKSNDIVFPRQIAMYLCRTMANASFPKIGDDFGRRDHTTVMHAYKKIDKELKTNPNTKLIVDNVKKNLLS